jgi:hypothetical protein
MHSKYSDDSLIDRNYNIGKAALQLIYRFATDLNPNMDALKMA